MPERCPRCGSTHDSLDGVAVHAWKMQDDAHADVDSKDQGMRVAVTEEYSPDDQPADDPPNDGDSNPQDGDGGADSDADGGLGLSGPPADPGRTPRTAVPATSWKRPVAALSTPTVSKTGRRTAAPTTTPVSSTMPDVTPADAVDVDPDDTAAGHAAAEGVEAPTSADVGSEHTLREMLMSTDPGRSLDQVESPWDPDRGGMTRIMRAIQKATGADGLPAVADLGIGIAEWWVSLDLDDDDSSAESTDSGGAREGAPPNVAEGEV